MRAQRGDGRFDWPIAGMAAEWRPSSASVSIAINLALAPHTLPPSVPPCMVDGAPVVPVLPPPLSLPLTEVSMALGPAEGGLLMVSPEK